jgi:hypothetical protein
VVGGRNGREWRVCDNWASHCVMMVMKEWVDGWAREETLALGPLWERCFILDTRDTLFCEMKCTATKDIVWSEPALFTLPNKGEEEQGATAFG